MLVFPTSVHGGKYDTLSSLTYESARTLLFDLMSDAYKGVESRGVFSNLPGKVGLWSQGKDPELVTRMMESMASYLSKADRPGQVPISSGGTFDVEEAMLKALKNGPALSGDTRWDRTAMQMEVEGATISWSTFLTKDRLLPKLSSTEKANLASFLKDVTKNYSIRENNYNCFFVVNASVCKHLGWAYEPKIFDVCLQKALNLYQADCWYTDDPGVRDFDEYNSWVFHTDLPKYCIISGTENVETRKLIMSRIPKYYNDQIRFFSSSGSHPENGRSTVYKTARLTGIIMAYYFDKKYNTPDNWNLGYTLLPKEVTPGMLKRLVRLHFNYYLRNGAIDPTTGIMLQRLTATGSTHIAENYISPGSVYWAMRAMGALMLIDDNDPFWSVPEEKLPADSGSFNYWVQVPGFLLTYDKNSDHLKLINSGNEMPKIGGRDELSQYCKFFYSSIHGFILKDKAPYSPDNMIQINVNGSYGHRKGVKEYQLQYKKPIRSVVYTKQNQVAGSANFDIFTLFFVKKDVHINVHKIVPQGYTGNYSVREGGYALGRNTSSETSETKDPNGKWVYRKTSGGAVMIGSLLKYNKIDGDINSGEKSEGGNSIHSRYPYYLIPLAGTSGTVSGQNVFASIVRGNSTTFNPTETYASVKEVKVNGDDVYVAFVEGDTLRGSFKKKTVIANDTNLTPDPWDRVDLFNMSGNGVVKKHSIDLKQLNKEFCLDLPSNGEYQLSLYDLNGKLVLKRNGMGAAGRNILRNIYVAKGIFIASVKFAGSTVTETVEFTN
jgi:hypothetical protein